MLSRKNDRNQEHKSFITSNMALHGKGSVFLKYIATDNDVLYIFKSLRKRVYMFSHKMLSERPGSGGSAHL